MPAARFTYLLVLGCLMTGRGAEATAGRPQGYSCGAQTSSAEKHGEEGCGGDERLQKPQHT